MKRRTTIFILAFGLLSPVSTYAQEPTGAVEGRVTDPGGAVIPAAQIKIVNEKTGLQRSLSTKAQGDYGAPALPAGVYKISAVVPGFRTLVAEATIEAGTITTVNLSMQVGSPSETVIVNGVAPQIQHNAFGISGVITRTQIEGLPLNDRDYLELAKLEPGAQQPLHVSNNRTLVPLLGAPTSGNQGNRTIVTVDGVSVMEIGNGGAALGLSQEVVQEFQVSTVNFDLSTGMTASGAINVATRSGTNQWHGSGFYFFRDHYLSAYPGLHRDPFDLNPYFQRQQYGVQVGGPILKDRLFIFGTFERNDQVSVVPTQLFTPEFVSLSGIFPSPSRDNQVNARMDWIINPKNSLFLRQTHQGVLAFGPSTANGSLGDGALPSNWTRQPSWVDQSVLGLTSQLASNIVNEFRFAYFFVSSKEVGPRESDCPGCLGINAPYINVADLNIGTSFSTAILARRFVLNDVVAWQKGTHLFRFGGDLEITRGGRTDTSDNPISLALFSPEQVRDFNATQPPSGQIPLPSSFLTVPDILQLPLADISVGIGNPHVPQAGFGNTRIAPLLHPFFQDTWRLRPKFTLIYGLGWSFDAPLNYDLRKPAYLEPIFGPNGLGPTRHNWTNFSPSIGFAWSPGTDGKTVIRGGFGIFYDFQSAFDISDPERVSLGPRGVGRESFGNESIVNPLSDVPGVPQGTLLNFFNPTQFTGASALEALPAIQTQLEQTRGGGPDNRDFSVTNIQVDKQGSVDARSVPNRSAVHVDFGVQRQIAQDFVISADFAMRRFEHISADAPGLVDANYTSKGPFLPPCTPSQLEDPEAECSAGGLFLTEAIGTARYMGLLVRAEKRFSHGFQMLASYAYSSDVGNSWGAGFNQNIPLANYGHLPVDFRNILNVSGLVQLPKKFQIGYFATWISRPAFSVDVPGYDLYGDGGGDDLLPGSKPGEFNRGLGKSDLVRLVNSFNLKYAGTFDHNGVLIQPLVLPSTYEFGDPLITQDLRLSRIFSIRDRAQFTLIGEVFNLFNIANYTRRGGDVVNPGFGQPGGRLTQVFGSGGPRAFQFAAKLAF